MLAFIVPIGVAGLFGFFNGWFITRFRVQSIVGTLAMFIAGRGIGQVLTNSNLQAFKNSAFKNPAFQFMRYVLSIGGNEEAARLMGLPVDRVKFLTYVQSGVCAGLPCVTPSAQFGAG